jgi:hypothetical protein
MPVIDKQPTRKSSRQSIGEAHSTSNLSQEQMNKDPQETVHPVLPSTCSEKASSLLSSPPTNIGQAHFATTLSSSIQDQSEISPTLRTKPVEQTALNQKSTRAMSHPLTRSKKEASMTDGERGKQLWLEEQGSKLFDILSSEKILKEVFDKEFYDDQKGNRIKTI